MGAPIGNRNAAGPHNGGRGGVKKRVGFIRTRRQKANMAKISAYQRSLYQRSRKLY